MKTTISILAMLTIVSTVSFGHDYIDDIYFKPSDTKKVNISKTRVQQKPNYKNGAKEIIYLDDHQNKALIIEKILFLLSEINDSILHQQNEANYDYNDDGYYLNGFKVMTWNTNMLNAYVDFIILNLPFIYRIHNTLTSILDDYNWNVYIGNSHAWVTPTWTNPYWHNYYWSPYSYSSLYWRNSWYYPFSYHASWHYGSWGHYPYYSWGSYYHPGYYGFAGYPYYGYYPYHAYYYNNYPYWGYTTSTKRNRNYNESVRRQHINTPTRASTTTRIAGGSNVGNTVAQRKSAVSSNRSVRATPQAGGNLTTTRTNQRAVSVENTNTATRTSSDYVRPSNVNTRTRTVANPSTSASGTNRSVATPSRGSTNYRGNTTTTTRSGSTIRTGTGTSNVRSTTPARSSTTSSRSNTSISTPSRNYSTPSSSSSRSTPSYSAPTRSSGSSTSRSSSTPTRSSSGGGRR